MRPFFIIIVISCSLCVAKAADEQVTNNTAIVVGTNVVCTLSINLHFGRDFGPPPVCFVKLANSASSRVWGLRLPAEDLFAVNLVDTNGQFIEKTEYGKKFGQPLTQKQVNDWFVPIRIQGLHVREWVNFDKRS